METVLAVGHTMGALLYALGAVLLVPLAVGLIAGEPHRPLLVGFGSTALGSVVLGFLLRLGPKPRPLAEVRAMLVCGLAWIVLSAIGAVPLWLLVSTSYLDAVFEMVSGFTTTGITMYAGLEEMPASVMFWRNWTQWFGGLGILTMYMVLTGQPAHVLAGAEAHKIAAARPRPGLANTLRVLWTVYLGLSVFVLLGLLLGGVGPFEAMNHAFTTVSTGGFSTRDESIAFYRRDGYSPAVIEWVVILGMLGGGTSFLVHYQTLKGSPSAWWRSSEARVWLLLLAGFLGLLIVEQAVTGSGMFATDGLTVAGFEHGIRTNLFQVLAILTTTGYATQDIASPYYGAAAHLLFLAMMLIGGCVGSTSGGIKVLRIVLLAKVFGRVVAGIVAPRGAIDEVVLDGRIVPSSEVRRVAGLFFVWLALMGVGGLVTALATHHDALASVSGMFSALNNIGPCYIPTPAMAELPAVVKVVYMLGMLAGRLEILPIALLFSPSAWRE